MKWFGKYMSGLENQFKTDTSRPRPRPRPAVPRPRPRPRPAVSRLRPRPRPQKIGLERSRDQDRGLEDYKTASRTGREATGGVYSYGQRQGSVENDGTSVDGPRPSEMRRGLRKARQL